MWLTFRYSTFQIVFSDIKVLPYIRELKFKCGPMSVLNVGSPTARGLNYVVVDHNIYTGLESFEFNECRECLSCSSHLS